MKRTVFLDRDGVLNEAVMRDGQPCSPRSFDEFVLCPEAAPAVSRLKQAGYLVIVVTNQPDIARGLLAPDELARMTAVLRAQVPVDEVCICSHDDQAGCACRKPRPGLLRDAAQHYGCDPAFCYLIGDTWKDMGAARAFGCHGILLDRDYNMQVACDTRVSSLLAAVDVVLRNGVKEHEHIFRYGYRG